VDDQETMHSGLHHLQVRDAELGLTFPAIVQYPTLEPPAGTQIGPYPFDATLDAPMARGRFPVCVISHGGGSSHLLHRTVATHLAKHGFIVVCLEHPGDNRNDRSLMNTDMSAANRPGHASLAIDAVLESPFLGHAADASRLCVVGHSMGGYTALALMGGQPWSRSRLPVNVRKDARIKAAVLMAPATDWYMAPDSLDGLSGPLLVLAAEHDDVTPVHRMRQVLERLPNTVPMTLQVIEGAGHFSFLSPFPAAMRRADFPPSTDPAGFDREQFHLALPRTVHAFLASVL